jgi:hypothetical protein
MKRKKFSNIVFVLFVIAIIGTIFYLNLNQEEKEPLGKQAQNSFFTEEEEENSKIANIDWEDLIPEIQIIIDEQLHKGMKIETMRPIRIAEEKDITGNGLPEALVYLGTGGAATDSFTLVRIEKNKPVIAEFRERNGNVSFLTFLSGTGGSGRYGLDVAMIEKENAICSTSFLAYQNESDYCRAEAYQWNPQTKIFEFNPDLSTEIEKEYCSNLCASIPSGLEEYFQKVCK